MRHPTAALVELGPFDKSAMSHLSQQGAFVEGTTVRRYSTTKYDDLRLIDSLIRDPQESLDDTGR